jgi:hypothetical protein
VIQPGAACGRARECETLPATENSGGGYFFRTLSGKAFAWIWKARDRELIILEQSCQVSFRRRVFSA